MKAKIFKRSIEKKIHKYLEVFPVVSIIGARQVGKSTLAEIIRKKKGMYYLTFDDLNILRTAKFDPEGFIESVKKPVIIDEVQRVPEILFVIKKYVDKSKKTGEFLLTGSSRYETIKGFKETLAGRIGMINLYPMNFWELRKRPLKNPVEEIFESKNALEYFYNKKKMKFDPEEEILKGGFPRPALFLEKNKRKFWFEEYRKTYIERDIPFILDIQNLPTFLSFMMLCASYSSKVFNLSESARTIGVSADTIRRWLNVLEITFLIEKVYVFRKTVKKRISKSPKLYFIDTGLLSNILKIEKLTEEVKGMLFETWFYNQLRSFSESVDERIDIFYFRTYTGREIDFVLTYKNKLIAIEVKYTKTIKEKYFKPLKEFIENVNYEKKIGILIYTGDEIIPFSKNIFAVPVFYFF